MGTATTGSPWSLRYPDGAVGAKPNVASDIKNLATDVASQLTAVNSAASSASTAASSAQTTANSANTNANSVASTRPRAAAGSVLMTLSDDGGGGFEATATITLPAGRFSAGPIIATGVYTGARAEQHAGVANVTATGFTLYYHRTTNTQTAVGWIAMAGNV